MYSKFEDCCRVVDGLGATTNNTNSENSLFLKNMLEYYLAIYMYLCDSTPCGHEYLNVIKTPRNPWSLGAFIFFSLFFVYSTATACIFSFVYICTGISSLDAEHWSLLFCLSRSPFQENFCYCPRVYCDFALTFFSSLAPRWHHSLLIFLQPLPVLFGRQTKSYVDLLARHRFDVNTLSTGFQTL